MAAKKRTSGNSKGATKSKTASKPSSKAKNIDPTNNIQERAVVAESRAIPQFSGVQNRIIPIQGIADEFNNVVRLEIEGIVLVNPVKVIKGPGYDIERIPGFFPDGRHNDSPGFAMPHSFVFESGGDDADGLKNYFDQYLLNPLDYVGKSFSLIIQNLDQSEMFRWNFYDFVPESYSLSTNDLTRFRWKKRHLPGEDQRFTGFVIQIDGYGGDPYGNELSKNPETDKLIEIVGVTFLYSQIEINENNRTITLTYRINEGKGMLVWVRNFVEGIADKRSISIIEEDDDETEISRRNYFECFPIKFEQSSGFSLPEKLLTRVIIAYSLAEDG